MLVVLLTTVLALFIAGSALLITDLTDNRRAWADDIATEANILALSVAPALSFNDRAAAIRSLQALGARASIRAATLYTAHGEVYAHYARSKDARLPTGIPNLKPGVRIDGGRVELLRPIVQSGEKLGTIYVLAQYDVTGRITAYASILSVVMLLSLAVALLASGWLQRVITEPTKSIATVARDIVEKRDYSLRANKSTHDDLGVLVDAFNNMLDEVQTRTHELERSNAALKATEQALREADRRKDEFLATLAHELRNPLAPVRNAVRILEMPGSDEQQRQYGREVISRQVRNMALLLDDLLDVSRITRGTLELKKDRVGLASVIEMALEIARPSIDAKKHSLVVHLPPENLTLEVDPLRLSQIVANLLTNAAKYTDGEGRVTLTAKLHAEGLMISIQDTGIGLAPETIPGLFAMFSQVNSVIDRAQGGLGIGLGLVKALVELHGGRVEAHSEGLGRGSEFIVYLPRTAIV